MRILTSLVRLATLLVSRTASRAKEQGQYFLSCQPLLHRQSFISPPLSNPVLTCPSRDSVLYTRNHARQCATRMAKAKTKMISPIRSSKTCQRGIAHLRSSFLLVLTAVISGAGFEGSQGAITAALAGFSDTAFFALGFKICMRGDLTGDSENFAACLMVSLVIGIVCGRRCVDCSGDPSSGDGRESGSLLRGDILCIFENFRSVSWSGTSCGMF